MSPQVLPKTIIVFCDGTGQDGLITDERPGDPKANHFTNVLRLSRSVTKTFNQGPEERLQITLYQSGVGVPSDFEAEGDITDKAKKALGTAVAAKIRDAYNFIARNYLPGDQICIFGFSRGAYTARKISGLIDRLGLLSSAEMGKFFDYWMQLNGIREGTPPPPTERVPIKCVGTWDTVGSVWNKLNALTLVDTNLPSNVEIALHAVSFHENRESFLPTLYTGAAEGQTLKQVWFPGAHSDVGGGYANRELADISLAWMVGEIESFIGVDKKFIAASLSDNGEKPAWGQSEPHNAYGEIDGFIEAQVIGWKRRLELLTRNSVLHESLLESPDIKDLLTISDIRKHLPGWNPKDHVAKLNEFESWVRKYWKVSFRDDGAPEFEGLDDLAAMF